MQIENLDYYDDKQLLEATVAKTNDEKMPAVLIFHAWAGKNGFVSQKAQEISKLGYHGIALDTYGKGVIGKTKDENASLMQPFMNDRSYLQKRLLSGVHFAKQLPYVDPKKLVVMGYCFGGLCALDVARSGEEILGAISFHGLLGGPDSKNSTISPEILVMHGDNDPMVTSEDVRQFQEEMRRRNANWELVVFGNTYHAFTNPQANDKDFGTVYSKEADSRSFEYMRLFLHRLFQ